MSEAQGPRITAELVRKYDRPGPRYTSYPTALEFSGDYGVQDYFKELEAANADSGKPLSLYYHLPFCEERCAFCACNVIITRNHKYAEQYLHNIIRETDLIAERLPDRRKAAQLHFGGGTPTYLTSEQLRRLFGAITERFEIVPGAEVAVEVHPSVTSDDQLRTLRELGFNRLSMGVQDLTPEVQKAIHRNQTLEDTQRIVYLGRELGFDSINVDLIYGLPLQKIESFERNLDQVLELRPDRVALYSFAHVPWIRRNQNLIDSTTLPSPEVKLELFVRATDRFLSNGYRKIGMDHFALPEDDMARALEARSLHRNFMGYTVRPTNAMIGFGVSSIGELQGNLMQNTKKLNRYYAAVGEGLPAIEHGYLLTDDDRVRRSVILGIMCNSYVDFAEIEAEHKIDASSYFAAEFEQLRELESTGLARIEGKTLSVTELGTLFVRNVAMVFDAYLNKKPGAPGDKPRFSRTV